ncbi:sporulation initiation phosphotransferase F [Oxobacter pfennigii]|uniref:Stage 0 sporulation protein A homolog n=1 Tax=Oxobacter pfennigii TaxID=36849 RepID=A0A0P8W588_9CLOT|nr:response regulator [Oxobacter pfennigii]KPU43778.1 sporulation initiation phosphotransferase F [Oxobacter pfennigii]
MGKRVLIVDDIKNIRKLLSTCLEVEGYEVITAVDGQQAIEMIERENIDLIFLDIKMPEISGTEVLKKIRAMNKNMPVIIMTAFATVKNAVECTKLGAVAYLQKPFSADKVRTMLDEMQNGGDRDCCDIEDYIKKVKNLISRDDYEEGFRLLKKALSIDPSRSEIYYLLGKVYENRGDNDKALKFFNTARQFDNGK